MNIESLIYVSLISKIHVNSGSYLKGSVAFNRLSNVINVDLISSLKGLPLL